MDKEFNQNTKLGDIFEKLNGVDLTVEDMDLPVSVHNYLKRVGVNDLQQILLMSEEELVYAGKNLRSSAPKSCAYVVRILEQLSRERR